MKSFGDCEIETVEMKNGKCFEYEGGRLIRECKYKKGVMIRVLREWKGDLMIEYDKKGMRVYEGGFERNPKKGFVRRGKGTEYRSDGKSVLYVGHWRNGHRHGYGEEYDEKGEVIRRGRWKDGVYGVRLRSGMNWEVYDNDCIGGVERLEIGNGCLRKVNRFVIDGLNELKSVKIGRRVLDTKSTRIGSECLIMNCDQLKEIHITNNSFCYYESFVCKNLPSLLSLRLGAKVFKCCHSVVIESSNDD